MFISASTPKNAEPLAKQKGSKRGKDKLFLIRWTFTISSFLMARTQIDNSIVINGVQLKYVSSTKDY